MAKTKLHQLHKIKIHDNRWLIWAIVYVLFVCIALVYYVKISDLNIDSENTAESGFSASRSYSDARLGFTVKYPTTWGIEADFDSSVNFVPDDSSDVGITVSVVNASAEKSLRRTLDILSESAMILDKVSATKIINDLGEGHTETVVLAIYNRKLYVIRGSENFVQKFLLTFHFK